MKKVIIDTSVWIEYFKGNEAAAAVIDDQAGYDLYVTGPIISELTQGMKTESEMASFTVLIESLPCLKILDQHWLAAGLTGSELRKKAITVPLPDLMIYTVAVDNNCAIFTLDNHFTLINKTLGHSMEIINLPLAEK
jgi:predicted nucleic acid-binding protein